MKLKRRDAFNEINITPLTDIFLVLLIIMMVVAPLLDQQGLNLLVPSNVEQQQMAEMVKIKPVDTQATPAPNSMQAQAMGNYE